MKKYILLFLVPVLLLASALLLNSCQKQLTEKPYSFLTPGNFYQNASDAQSAINGVLSALQPQAYYQITPYNRDEFYGLLAEAAYVSGDSRYATAAHKMSGRKDVVTELLWGKWDE